MVHVERLEERRLLAVDVGVSQLTSPAPTSMVGTQTFTYLVTNSDSTAATTGTAFTDTYTAPAGTTATVSDSAGDFTTQSNYLSGTAISFATQLGTSGTDTVTISFTTTQAGQLVNTASVTETGDTNTSNNTVGPTTLTVSTPTTTGTGFFLQSAPGDDTVPTAITNLYWNLLGRAPDTAGYQAWVAYGEANQNAAGDETIVSGFLNSPEYKTHYVTAVYQDFLGRAPDAGGLAFWTDKLGDPGTPGGHGGSADEKYVVAAILGSTEFYDDAGGTAQGWVNALYQDLLGRAPDGNGMSFWQNELAVRGAGDRDGIVRDLLSAPETVHYLLDAFYPAPGGTTTNPLPAPGSAAGTSGDKLALLTGGGWENLYFGGPYDSSPEGDDAFFDELVGGGSWDDVQAQMLTSHQYTDHSVPNSGPTQPGELFGSIETTETLADGSKQSQNAEMSITNLNISNHSLTGNVAIIGSTIYDENDNAVGKNNSTSGQITGTQASDGSWSGTITVNYPAVTIPGVGTVNAVTTSFNWTASGTGVQVVNQNAVSGDVSGTGLTGSFAVSTHTS